MTALSLALFAKHALEQELIYDIFAVPGIGLVTVGLYRIFDDS